MIDHVVLNVSDLKASRAFYEKALEPLGMDLLGDYQGYIGFGKDRVSFFWLTARKETSQNVHVAFGCDERPTVDAFYEDPACARSITPTTTGRLCSTPMETTSKRSVTRRSSQ